MRNKKVPNRNSLPFFFLVHHWNRSYIFTLILSTMKRKMELNDNFVFPKMLQSVAWLSFPVFDGGLKTENWKLQSIFKFCLSAAERSRSLTALAPQGHEGGGGIHSHGRKFGPSPSPQPRFLPYLRSLGSRLSSRSLSFGNVRWLLCLFVAQFCSLRWAVRL